MTSFEVSRYFKNF